MPPHFRDPPEHFGPDLESIDPKFAAVQRLAKSRSVKNDVEKTLVQSLEERNIAVKSIFNQIERLDSEQKIIVSLSGIRITTD